nr:MAG TPA: hypothetical protein [Caudoviricetes sp.]
MNLRFPAFRKGRSAPASPRTVRHTPQRKRRTMKSWWHGHTSAKPTGQSSPALSGLTLRQSTPFPIRGASAGRPKRLTIRFCQW